MTVDSGDGHDRSLISETDGQSNDLLRVGSHQMLSTGNITSGSNIIQLKYCTGPMIGNSAIQDCETSEGHGFPLNSSDILSIPRSHDSLSASSCPSSCPRDEKVTSKNNTIDQYGTQNLEPYACSFDQFMYTNLSVISPSGDWACFHPSDKNFEKKTDSVSTPMKMVTTRSDVTGCTTSPDENRDTQSQRENQLSEALFYEPPQFPSLELPFLSCDLISSSDLQQEYSPLGIQQLTMACRSCSTPYKLWESPIDDSSDAVLNNVAKSFLCPSIMKKRQCKLLSPLREGKSDKKSEKGINHELETCSANPDDCSYIDVICAENGSCRAFFSSIESTVFSSPCYQKKKSGISPDEKENMIGNKGKDKHIVLGTDYSSKRVQWSSKKESGTDILDAPKDLTVDAKPETDGMLVEHNINDKKLFSSLKENIDIFMDTPGVKRGIESPSAWKSPWFMNEFLPGLRDDIDIPFEMDGRILDFSGCGTPARASVNTKAVAVGVQSAGKFSILWHWRENPIICYLLHKTKVHKCQYMICHLVSAHQQLLATANAVKSIFI